MISKLLFGHRCYHGGPLHDFQARITTERKPLPVDLCGVCYVGAFERVSKASTHVRESYHGDVCTWCGKVINEQHNTTGPNK